MRTLISHPCFSLSCYAVEKAYAQKNLKQHLSCQFAYKKEGRKGKTEKVSVTTKHAQVLSLHKFCLYISFEFM